MPVRTLRRREMTLSWMTRSTVDAFFSVLYLKIRDYIICAFQVDVKPPRHGGTSS